MINVSVRRKVHKIVMQTLFYVFATIIALFFIFPLLWMLVTSTKTELQYAKDLGSFATFLPYVRDLSTFFDNYASVVTKLYGHYRQRGGNGHK